MKTLLVDNYDSYTYNLFQLMAAITGRDPVVVHNDACSWSSLAGEGFERIVISPGPGSPACPADVGMGADIMRQANVPVLGVCLGHQLLATAFGGRVGPANEVMHGRISRIFHDGAGLFEGIPQGFDGVRYHSLIVRPPLPEDLAPTAWTDTDEIMGLRHRARPLYGVQFHPESICTEHGRRLIENFLGVRYLTLSHRGGRGQGEGARRFRPYHVRAQELSDWVEPETAFAGLFGEDKHAFWLDSADAPDRNRFSYMGASDDVLTHHVARGDSDLFTKLAARLEASAAAASELPFPFVGGWVGYLGYELKAECGAPSPHRSRLPDATLLWANRFLAFDHVERRVWAVALAPRGAAEDGWLDQVATRLRGLGRPEPPSRSQASGSLPFRLRRSRERYLRDIACCQAELLAGNSYEICLTNEISIDATLDPLTLYRHLRRLNPAPHAAYLRLGDVAVLSSSPESFLRVDGDGWAETKPIKGTLARGHSPTADQQQLERLRASDKDRAENLMIVDLLRNDLGKVCQPGSVSVPKLMDVESFATIHQLVSTIRGHLRAGVSAVDCLRALFPGGSMTGAPKLRTMAILDELEDGPRGIYSGGLGFLSANGTADLAMTIRTIVWQPELLTIGAGGAIVAASDPEAEYEEMLLKAGAPMQAILAALGCAGATPAVE